MRFYYYYYYYHHHYCYYHWFVMMDWNLKAPLHWDWENQGLFHGKEGRVIGAGSGYSSDLGNGSSRSCSISASVDSSSRAGLKISGFNFEAVEALPKGCDRNKESAKVEDTGTSPAVMTQSGLGEPWIGLKLGKRTYFEDVFSGNNTTKNLVASTTPTVQPSSLVNKKGRVSHQSIQNSRCQVEGCNIDLSGAKDYHRKHRVCASHSKCPKVVIAGQERRFCQQCSRFHDLSEFDQKKRSCRRRLSDHNARRRKPHTDTISFNSSRLASPFYDDRQQMNFLFNRSPFGHVRHIPSSSWEDSRSFSLSHPKGSPVKSTKADGVNGQMHFSISALSNPLPALPHDLDKLLSFKGTTAEVLNQGLEVPLPPSNLDGAPDLQRALSLLSTDSWDSMNPGQRNLAHPANTGHNFATHPAMQAVSSTGAFWPDQQSLPQLTRALPFDLHNNSGHYQEFQLPKSPYEAASFFDSGQMLSKMDGHFLEFKT